MSAILCNAWRSFFQFNLQSPHDTLPCPTRQQPVMCWRLVEHPIEYLSAFWDLNHSTVVGVFFTGKLRMILCVTKTNHLVPAHATFQKASCKFWNCTMHYLHTMTRLIPEMLAHLKMMNKCSLKVYPQCFHGWDGRTRMLGMVITGNASAEINQCHPRQKPPTAVGLSISECLACNVE